MGSTAFCEDPPKPTEEQTPVSAQQTPVSVPLSPEEIHELQETAFQAAERGDGDELLRCVRLGADPWSWMSRAARKCRPETLEAILKHMRERTPADEAWITEAHIAYSNRNWLNNAVSAGNLAMTEYLLAEGKVDVNARNFKGETPLLALAGSYMPKLETLQLLLDHGADIHARDDEGNTVLHRPFFWLDVYLQVMEFLVKQGVDRSVKNHDGKTALDLYRKSSFRLPRQLETLLDPQTPIVHE